MNKKSIIAILLVVLTLFSCSLENEGDDSQLGNLSVTLNQNGDTSRSLSTRAITGVDTIVVNLVHEDYAPIRATDSLISGSVSLTGIKVGSWKIQASLIESVSGETKYFGEQDVEILPGVTESVTVLVFATGNVNSSIVEGLLSPYFSLESVDLTQGIMSVKITSPTSHKIRYTIDGSDPDTANTTAQSSPCVVTEIPIEATVKAKAVDTSEYPELYSEIESFTYSSGSTETATVSAVVDMSSVTGTKATINGSVVLDGGTTVTSKGVVWGTTSGVIQGDISSDSVEDNFSLNLNNLEPDTIYYIRAYAVNGMGLAYSDEVVFQTDSVYHIGDNGPAGGIVFYDKGYATDGWRYLEAALEDYETTATWYNGSYIETFATEADLGTGYRNTEKIVATQGDGTYAAKICADMEIGGYTDWYLPSKDELLMIYEKKDILGDFSSSYYWSSTEYDNNEAYRVYFYNGSAYDYSTSYSYYIRAIRSFSQGAAATLELPTINTTLDISTVTGSKITAGGTIINDGGSPISQKGVVWSTTPGVIASQTEEGSGNGEFNTLVTGMTPGTVYYLRAYATNSIGTAYGDEIAFQTDSNYHIGDNGPAGGLIFYDKGYISGGWRYLELSPKETEWTNIEWGAYGTDINGYDNTIVPELTAIGTGILNTTAIVTELTNLGETGKAAQLCNDLEYNGYIDWFLPSKDELEMVYTNITLNNFETFPTSYYWSSTEVYYAASSCRLDTYYNYFKTYSSSKNSTNIIVRAIRMF